jgi:hypothetical protein
MRAAVVVEIQYMGWVGMAATAAMLFQVSMAQTPPATARAAAAEGLALAVEELSELAPAA